MNDLGLYLGEGVIHKMAHNPHECLILCINF